MPFTDKEKRRWLEEKRQREHRPQPACRSQPIAVCVNCGNPFGANEGTITAEVALCDICSGD